jgi:hypothetical protein
VSTTVAAIAAEAFDDVDAEITGVIRTGTVTRAANATYSAGTYSASTSTQTVRVIEITERETADVLPGYVASPGEVPLLIEGATSLQENDTITVSGRPTRKVARVGDIVGAGTLFVAVAVAL